MGVSLPPSWPTSDTVLAEHRRRGYTTEAILGRMDAAGNEHGIHRFRLAISPANAPSRSLAERLRFEAVRRSRASFVPGAGSVWVAVMLVASDIGRTGPASGALLYGRRLVSLVVASRCDA